MTSNTWDNSSEAERQQSTELSRHNKQGCFSRPVYETTDTIFKAHHKPSLGTPADHKQFSKIKLANV